MAVTDPQTYADPPCKFGLANHQPIAQGVYGKVYVGTELAPPQAKVAIKVFRDQLEALPEMLRHAAFPRHPAIITVQDVMMTTMGNIKAVGLVFPWFDMDLQRFMQKLYLQPAGVRLVLRRVCEALAHLHLYGLVHSDVKPDNILLRWGCGCISEQGDWFQALKDAAAASADDDAQCMLKYHLEGALEVHRCCSTKITTMGTHPLTEIN